MPKVSQNILNSFSTLLNGRNNIPFDEFVNWALYDSQIGYYQSSRKRVGKERRNDFYTSTSLGKTWGELIIESSINLLGERLPSEYVFVEIGAEPNQSILDGLIHPFADHQIRRLGAPMDIPEKSIVYSNEWLDARPFKRFQYCGKESCWMEIFVGFENLEFVEIAKKSPYETPSSFPSEAVDGYLIDWPTGALISLDQLISETSWRGIFLTFDYGLDMKTILKERPEGTARAYSKQRMDTDLLKHPGQKDLTCHICWDSLKNSLKYAGFNEIELSSQESFLIKNASGYMQKIFEQNRKQMNSQMLALRELIHPAHLGHGLQALSANRF